MKALFGILTIAFGLTLVQCDREEEQDIKHTQEPVEANCNAEVDTVNPPEFSFPKEHYDFGTIKEGKQIEYDFKFTNTGKSPLLICKAYGSCGCTVPEFPEEPIMPGQTSKIHVVFNSARKGDQKIYKTVTIIANTYPEDATVISVGGFVKK